MQWRWESLPLLEMGSGRPARSLVTILTELPRLLYEGLFFSLWIFLTYATKLLILI